MMIYGFHPVREALRLRPQDVEWVLLSERAQRARVKEIEKLCSRLQVRFRSQTAGVLDEMTSGAVHNGFVAEVRARTVPAQGADAGLVVLLEDVQDPRNLGAILRVCEGAGVGRILIRDRGSAPLSAAAIKTSAGAAEYLSIDRITNSANEIEALQKEGFWVYGADGEGESIWDVDLTGKVCFCLGGEEKGLRPRTRKLCDRLVALPMRGKVRSLNVATASAALLYEALRQRSAGTWQRTSCLLLLAILFMGTESLGSCDGLNGWAYTQSRTSSCVPGTERLHSRAAARFSPA